MNSELEILFSRRPSINYVSPAICEGDVSSTGSPVIVLQPFPGIPKLTGVFITEVGGTFRLEWETTDGAVCYNIYEVIDGELVLVLECVPNSDVELPPGGGEFVVTPITPDGEGPPSDPVSTDEPVIDPPIDPPSDCPTESGVPTTCDLTGPYDVRYRIKDYSASWFDITSCGLTDTICRNCQTQPDTNCVDAVPWTGTFPVREFNIPGVFHGWIDQEYEYGPFDMGPPPPAHQLHGFCIVCTLRSASVSSPTGCGWAVRIDGYYNGSFTPLVWTGEKKVGETPAGRYYRTSGCCPGPECLEIEAY